MRKRLMMGDIVYHFKGEAISVDDLKAELVCNPTHIEFVIPACDEMQEFAVKQNTNAIYHIKDFVLGHMMYHWKYDISLAKVRPHTSTLVQLILMDNIDIVKKIKTEWLDDDVLEDVAKNTPSFAAKYLVRNRDMLMKIIGYSEYVMFFITNETIITDDVMVELILRYGTSPALKHLQNRLDFNKKKRKEFCS